MRRFVCVVALALGSCTIAFDDFEVCDADPIAEQLPYVGTPCTAADGTCYRDCGSDEMCAESCYAANVECGHCITAKPFECLRANGCRDPFDRMVCCVEANDCELERERCPVCEPEFAQFDECAASIRDDCDDLTLYTACFGP